jgi:hypothetical protein
LASITARADGAATAGAASATSRTISTGFTARLPQVRGRA